MKSLKQFSSIIQSSEKLEKGKFWAVKGGDDKRPERPIGGGGTPQPNGNTPAWGNDGSWD